MASVRSKSSASPSTTSPVVFTSPREPDAHLEAGDTHDLFVYRGDDREVVLRNDCRAYPLRVRATFSASCAEFQIETFARRCRDRYRATFEESIPGARAARLSDVARKAGLYAGLDTVDVHFYKDADRNERRTVIGWLVEPHE